MSDEVGKVGGAPEPVLDSGIQMMQMEEHAQLIESKSQMLDEVKTVQFSHYLNQYLRIEYYLFQKWSVKARERVALAKGRVVLDKIGFIRPVQYPNSLGGHVALLEGVCVCGGGGGATCLQLLPHKTLGSCSDPTSHEENGLVTIERFFGCAESTVLILDKPMK